MSVSTHVLDAATGQPAAGMTVRLQARGEAAGPAWAELGCAVTDRDGRVRAWATAPGDGSGHRAGVHRLVFATGEWFASQHRRTFYPEVVVVFEITEAATHHHVPLLLAPFGYSTYRGS